MKKIIALFCCIAILLCGCGKATESDSESTKTTDSVSDTVIDNNNSDIETSAQQNDNKINEVSCEYISYLPVLKDTYALIVTDTSEIVSGDGQTGIVEMIGGLGNDGALDGIGYAILDINGDNVSELIIAAINDEYYGNGNVVTRILAVYTLVNKAPTLVTEGWYRNRFFLKPDGTFYFEGSGGAAYTLFGISELTSEGNFKYLEYYYSDIDDNTGDAVYFMSTEYPVTDSSAEAFTKDEFLSKNNELSTDVVKIDLTSFRYLKDNDFTITS